MQHVATGGAGASALVVVHVVCGHVALLLGRPPTGGLTSTGRFSVFAQRLELDVFDKVVALGVVVVEELLAEDVRA